MNNCQSIDAGTHTEKGRDDTSDELAMIKAISIPPLIRGGGCSGVGAPPYIADLIDVDDPLRKQSVITTNGEQRCYQ